MTNEQHIKHLISESSETKLISVTDSHYLLSMHKPNIEHSFNINLDTLPLEHLDISRLYPKFNKPTRKE